MMTGGHVNVPLQVRNISKEELAKMDPEERKKPYVCESKCCRPLTFH